MNVHFIVHEAFEAPGAYETWANDRGHSVTHTRLYAGQTLPVAVDNIDMVVVMGGPQRPSTTKTECSYFDAAAEKAFIRKCIDTNKALVGVCLGSQLIGEALGAAFDASPQREIGVFPIKLTPDGRSNTKFAHFGSALDVGHWHNDMPGLTADAKVIATSTGCPRQIVEFTNLVYGFQCHMEFNLEIIEALIETVGSELSNLSGNEFVQPPDVLRKINYTTMNEKLFIFLDRLTAAYSSGKKLSRGSREGPAE